MSAGMARRKVKTSALQDGDPRKKDKKKGWYSGWTKYILTEVRDFFLLLGILIHDSLELLFLSHQDVVFLKIELRVFCVHMLVRKNKTDLDLYSLNKFRVKM